MALRRLALLGSTGSIGCSALQVLALHPDEYDVVALSGNRNWELMLEQVRAANPDIAVMCDEESAQMLQSALQREGLTDTTVKSGADSIVEIASDQRVDTVLAGIVGAAGLQSTLAAAAHGKRILLANKEALVMCGDLLMQTARDAGALIMPVDSEHNAIFQCLSRKTSQNTDQKNPASDTFQQPAAAQSSNLTGLDLDMSSVEKIILTASGGPFRGMTKEQLSVVSLQQALKHPNWSMGPKITVDSASLMNKGLEVIEACFLFGVAPSLIEVVVHPESVIHSMVRYADGSVLAQLGQPDMRTPIAHALAWPQRIAAGVQALDLVSVGQLNFEKPDTDTFPCLRLAFEALAKGQTAATVLNAANEIAVDAFMSERVSFIQLPDIIDQTLASIKLQTAADLDTILIADKEARQFAASLIRSME